MADRSLPCSLPPQPKPDPIPAPEELETLAKIIRNRNGGFLPTVAECDLLIELVQRYMGGGR